MPLHIQAHTLQCGTLPPISGGVREGVDLEEGLLHHGAQDPHHLRQEAEVFAQLPAEAWRRGEQAEQAALGLVHEVG